MLTACDDVRGLRRRAATRLTVHICTHETKEWDDKNDAVGFMVDFKLHICVNAGRRYEWIIVKSSLCIRSEEHSACSQTSIHFMIYIIINNHIDYVNDHIKHNTQFYAIQHQI